MITKTKHLNTKKRLQNTYRSLGLGGRNNMKTQIMNIIALVALLLAFMPMADALNSSTIEIVEIDNVDVTNDRQLYVQRGDNIDIRTVITPDVDLRDATVEVMISGYRYQEFNSEMVRQNVGPFDLRANVSRSDNLRIQIPNDIKAEDAKLRVFVTDRNSDNAAVKSYQLVIDGIAEDEAVEIRDFFISPTRNVEAGRALNFDVVVRNLGTVDLDDVTARVSIPALGLTRQDTITSLERDESKAFEALMLRIPQNTEAGVYTVNLEVRFDRYRVATETATFEIVDAPRNEPTVESTMTLQNSINLQAGAGERIIPILLENRRSTPQTFVLDVEGVNDFGTSSFNGNNVVVVPGANNDGPATTTVHLSIAANADAEHEDKVFTVVARGDSELRQTVIANISGDEPTQETDLRNVLEWSLIVLVALLIILGLVLLVSKMRGGKNEPEGDDTQTYY